VTEPRRHRRPSLADPTHIETLGGWTDPVERLHAAHETAATLVRVGAEGSAARVERLISVIDEVGITTVADLWAERPARTLPGALWRLYRLREWTRANPDEAAREYGWGIGFTEANHAVAGVDPPGRHEMVAVADQILRGAFTGDFAVALERAAAFCLVVAAGRAYATEGTAAATGAARLQELAIDLTACAKLWRAGRLE
jgi:hypothetical protein